MNKVKRLTILLIVLLLTLTSCNIKPNPMDSKKDIKVSAVVEELEININNFDDFDFKEYFTITVDKSDIEVKDEYIDKTGLKKEVGEYQVVCKYEKVSASIKVRVVADAYEITLLKDEISIYLDEVENYNYVSLFKLTINGKENVITKSMIETDIKKEVGVYTYTVSYKDVSKTLTINVLERVIETNLEVIPAYQLYKLNINEVNTFDYTKLFSLYVNGTAEKVTDEMIDTSSIIDVEIGKNYIVNFNFTLDDKTVSAKVKIEIVDGDKIVINAKDALTYPNGGYIDLTTLFEIKKGTTLIPVKPDMISGKVDYTKEGMNIVTINYQGETATATVEVRRGVIIDYASSDTIIITKGTSKETYAFYSDFIVRINGIIFKNISEEYLDTTSVDFTKVGTYQVTLKIPYNDAKLGLSQVKFKYFEKTITYVVVENNYEINIIDDVVILKNDTKKYDVFKNLDVLINNRFQTLTRIKENVDLITCYAEELSEAIDFNKVGRQEVRVAVYVNGPSLEPVIVTFYVMMESQVDVKTIDKIVTYASTVYAKDLFKIIENGSEIPVTNEMVSGKVDTFASGTYTVTIDYKGILATATVTVLNENFVGRYHTKLKTQAKVEEYEDDDEPVIIEPSVPYGDVVITQDLKITINKKEAVLVKGVNEDEIIVKQGSTEYKLTLIDGILIVNPINDIKLSFSNERRPLIYFHEDFYKIEDMLTVNSISKYVLDGTSICFSIDAFKLTSLKDNTTSWYGLKIYLVEKTSADTIYDVSYGEVTISELTNTAIGSSGYITFKSDAYRFVIVSEKVAKISKEAQEKKFAGKSFTGTIDGKEARLVASQYETFSLSIEGKAIFSFNMNDQNALLNGGVDYNANTVFLYSVQEGFSYKFVLNVEDGTFEYVSKDLYYGKYVKDNICIFLDGYGTGIINFNTKSYYQTQIKYQAENNDILITYINTKPTFEYGENALFYIDDFKNTLISQSFMNGNNDVSFENENITDGAIVHIYSYQVGSAADAVAKNKMIANIEIITKDGKLSNDEKLKYIDTSKIKFSKPGFYQLTITLPVGENNVTCYYAIEVLDAKYKDNEIVGEYGTGVLNEANILSIDQYGQVIVECSGILFRGNIKIYDDLSFVIKASNDEKGLINIIGEKVMNGVIVVRCNGAATFSDYFTKGSVNVVGNDKLVLRQFIYGTTVSYILSNSQTSLGEIVTIDEYENSIIKINKEDVSYIARITCWGNIKNGLQMADSYRGEYTSGTLPTIKVDGFGSAVIGNDAGTYILSDNVIIVTIGKEIKTYKLDKSTYQYEILNINYDESLVLGKTYSSTYSFVCSGYFYSAKTKFKFNKNGVVTIYSTSEEHDSGDASCTEDTYNPSFGSKTGVKGTYSVQGNRITVTVAGQTIVFVVSNVVTVDEIVTLSSTIDKAEQGYFSENTVFSQE